MGNATDRITEEQRAKALAYLKGEMPEPERADFESALAGSELLREELSQSRAILDTLAIFDLPDVATFVIRTLATAILANASDLHILPQRSNVQVLIRVDGSLRLLFTFHKSLQASFIDRIKVMADMNVGDKNLPQDGRFTLKHGENDFDVRVNVLPTLYGERITARFSSKSPPLLGFDSLNLSAASIAALQRLAKQETGLILTSGHTGSGKTTLMYSLLLELQKSSGLGRNLMTVEDPIDTQLNGVSQTQINSRAGLTFVAALKSMLRSDADVILCGELRDRESADLCVHLALVGHLVLSALHTNSALDTIQRLRNIGIENSLIADTLAGAIGQRLVRRIDPAATEEYQPADEELKQAGLTRDDGPFLRGVATKENGETGYKGRIPLLEVVEMTQPLRRMIAENTSVEDLWRVAFRPGGSLRDEGRSRIKAGLTTVEEVNRVLSNYAF